MSEPWRRVEGPMSTFCVEFAGRSYAEMFQAAADWFAANDGALDNLHAVGIRELDWSLLDEPDQGTWFTMSIAYDGPPDRNRTK
ncbi:hypothetical protein [Nocardia vaccinii]|uniref:hypothetical protein n=1 Tax=Nocardia vaccinii TaxID=1822 RepID=UPI0008362277|nr:hypothetical protein [Nocardia vaccinii]